MATIDGRWAGYGVGDADDPNLPNTAPNYRAVSLINEKLTNKYQWARDLGMTHGTRYTTTTAIAIEEFCHRVGITPIYDADGYAVANLAMRARLGSYPPPTPILPLVFSVEGHMSNLFAGPVADTATILEREGVCRHQPVGYRNGNIPFDNNSGVTELARLVGSTVMDNGVPFPDGTPWTLAIFSQGAIVGYDFYTNYLQEGQPLHWRFKDLRGVLAYGNPCRATNSIAPWAQGWIKTPNTHGLDPYRRFGIPGQPTKPDNWVDVYREGDIFAQNDDSKSGAIKAAVYQAVARGDVFSNPYSLARQIADLFLVPFEEVVGIVMAIVSGIGFLATGDRNPHYSPYDIGGGIDWMRRQLTTITEVSVA